MKLTRLPTKEIINLAVVATFETMKYADAKPGSLEYDWLENANGMLTAYMNVLGYDTLTEKEQLQIFRYLQKQATNLLLDDEEPVQTDTFIPKALTIELCIQWSKNASSRLEDMLINEWKLINPDFTASLNNEPDKLTLFFNGVDKTITLKEQISNLNTSELDLFLIESCIHSCDDYLEELSTIDIKESSVAQVNDELTRLHSMHVEALTGNGFSIIYSLETSNEEHLDFIS